MNNYNSKKKYNLLNDNNLIIKSNNNRNNFISNEKKDSFENILLSDETDNPLNIDSLVDDTKRFSYHE